MAENIARRSRWLIAAALMLTVASLGSWWYGGEAQATVRVDGEEIAVVSRAPTVGDALREEGVTLGAHDRVFPPLHADLEDGARIRVVRAHPITVELNGAEHQVWTTATTVRDVMRELGIAADVVEPSRSAAVERGSRVVLRNAHEITVVVDGETETLETTARTVRDVLDELDVRLDADDEVTPSPETEVAHGMTVSVTRVDSEPETETGTSTSTTQTAVEEREIPFETIRRDDPSLPRGEVQTVQEGSNGLERLEYRVVVEDGEVVDSDLVSSEVVRAPVDRVLNVGTKPPNYESGEASWYDAPSMTCAHKTLPMGTEVSVVNVSNGRSVVCTVADRGPYVEGRIIDLAHDAFSQLADPGAGVISVRISW